MRYRKNPRPTPSGGLELYSWFFMRVTGILLAGFVIVHLVIMHIINNVEKINFKFVAHRWENPAWRFYDLMLLTLALLHGGNGFRIIIDDYVHSRFWRTVWVAALYTVWFAFFVIGAMVILIFKGRP